MVQRTAASVGAIPPTWRCGARMETRTGSGESCLTSARRTTPRIDAQRTVVGQRWANTANTMRRTGRAVSAPRVATNDRSAITGGRQPPEQAPFGRTGTSIPLITRRASPVPTDPKMNVESRATIVAPSGG
jgi:hypothetical protein